MAWNIWSKKRQKDLWGDMDKSIGMQEFYNKSFSERGQAGKKNNLLKKKDFKCMSKKLRCWNLGMGHRASLNNFKGF